MQPPTNEQINIYRNLLIISVLILLGRKLIQREILVYTKTIVAEFRTVPM